VTTEVRELIERAGWAIPEPDLAFFEELRARVVAANERMNLTRLVEPADFFVKHVVDSWMPFLRVPQLAALPEELRAADLGSGVGFPGLVLARMRPRWRVGLIERTRKKAAFLEETAAALELGNVTVLAHEVRELARARPEWAGSCRLVTARAVGRIDPVSRWCRPLLAPRGVLVHYKGGTVDRTELGEGRNAAFACRYLQSDPVAWELPNGDARSVVLCTHRPDLRGKKLRRRP